MQKACQKGEGDKTVAFMAMWANFTYCAHKIEPLGSCYNLNLLYKREEKIIANNN